MCKKLRKRYITYYYTKMNDMLINVTALQRWSFLNILEMNWIIPITKWVESLHNEFIIYAINLTWISFPVPPHMQANVQDDVLLVQAWAYFSSNYLPWNGLWVDNCILSHVKHLYWRDLFYLKYMYIKKN